MFDAQADQSTADYAAAGCLVTEAEVAAILGHRDYPSATDAAIAAGRVVWVIAD